MEWIKIKNEQGEIVNLPDYNIPVVLWDNKGKRWFLGERVLSNVGDSWALFPGNILVPVNTDLYHNSVILFCITHYSNLTIPKDVLS